MMRAQALVESGRIGRVVNTVGLGPHSLSLKQRPEWFYDPAQYGGILVDIGSHQVDQFLAFTGATDARVVAAHVRAHDDHHGLEVLGEMMLAADEATGYTRVDYFTPAGLGAWGDVRFTAIGTDVQAAADGVRAMHGAHRTPTLLGRVDHLARTG